MDQISFFSAEASGPELADLAGVLCGPGRIVGFGRTAARLAVEVGQAWRAKTLVAEFARRGVQADVLSSPAGRPLVRTAFRVDLIGLANAWGTGEGKEVPAGFRLSGGALRIWALAGGRPGDNHYLLEVDVAAPDTHAPLVEAVGRLGLPAQVVGPRSGGPAVRVTGRRRLSTLEELLGAPPPAAAPGWPRVAPAKRFRRESGSAA